MRPVPLDRVLASHDFAGLARAMEGAALNEAMAVETLAAWNTREPDRIKAQTLHACRERAEALAAAHAIFLALAPREATVRDMIGGAAQSHEADGQEAAPAAYVLRYHP